MTLNRRHALAALATTPLSIPAGGTSASGEMRFALGMASGNPRPDSVVLWTRLTGAALPPAVPVRWELARDEAFTQVAARGEETALADEAHSVHAEPAGLETGRSYWYRFTALGQRSATGRTRTAPAPGQRGQVLRFAIASCQRWDHGHWAAWRHLAAEAPDLVLFLGDYIYEYPSPPGVLRAHEGGLVSTLDGYRERHAQYKSDPLLQAAHAVAPWVTIWDDHEVANDYAGLDNGLLVVNFARRRAAAYRAWWEHMPVPKAWRPDGPDLTIHHRLDWGALARIHAIDTRQWRDPQACRSGLKSLSGQVNRAECPELDEPARTLLGAAQERWLAAGWDRDRPWNLLAQQTLMAGRTSEPTDGPSRGRYWSDGWDGYPAARRRLLQDAAGAGARNLVVLGGDVHAHYVADLRADHDDRRGPVLGSEFCGTSISSRGPSTAATDRARRLNPHLHHARGDARGYVAFELDERRLQARLMAVRDAADPHSAIDVDARFAVEAGRPGPQSA
ncbi:MAG: alkaline phosphatase D family protein [Aquabacterium sp.]